VGATGGCCASVGGGGGGAAGSATFTGSGFACLPDFFLAGLVAFVFVVVVLGVVVVFEMGVVCAKPSVAASARIEMEASLVMKVVLASGPRDPNSLYRFNPARRGGFWSVHEGQAIVRWS
jgi:hypothetical protein